MTEKPAINLDEYYENYQKPWWWYRCVHRSHSYWVDPDGNEFGCFSVLREAEGVAIVAMVCLPQVHICVELSGKGSVCKTLQQGEWAKLREPEIMRMVQSMHSELKSL